MGKDVGRCEFVTKAISGPRQEGYEQESISVGCGGYLKVFLESEDIVEQEKLWLWRILLVRVLLHECGTGSKHEIVYTQEFPPSLPIRICGFEGTSRQHLNIQWSNGLG
ncbi:hypothetical protein R1flu_028330 [Riccia fluitans]|uniref:Uncharacterized protein n=1 Tax=Riccia fluitans TaxID=41844 RepID=A0ABD1XLC2_9MARC